NYAFHRGYQVLHALRNRGAAGAERDPLERMERCSGAAASAGKRRRHARAAIPARAELRSGFGRDQDFALGTLALMGGLNGYPLADFLPFIESPHLEPPA